MLRIAVLLVGTLIVAGWTHPPEKNFRLADINRIADAYADKDMDIAEYYIGRRDYTGAINRLKVVVTQFRLSRHVEEALVRLIEAYLALGIPSEAQTAAAVLHRKFPNGHWSTYADSLLKSAELEPIENETSWISRSLK